MPTRRNSPAPMNLADLAPGEAKAARFDIATLDVRTVRSSRDAAFHEAYDRLWAEFGAAGEMEAKAVIERRLAWDPATPLAGLRLRYELLLARDPARANEFAAVRDHTAIVPAAAEPHAIVHLSHVLVAPAWRGGGLAGWMRAWPIATARACLAAAGARADAPVTLVAEMEHPRADQLATMIRLRAYEKAGFMKIDPRAVRYLQPDFRPPDQIDADPAGVRPLPMGLVVRRVGRERDPGLSGREVRQVVASLYAMYGIEFRPQDMRPVYDSLIHYPPDDAVVTLVPPTTAEAG